MPKLKKWYNVVMDKDFNEWNELKKKINSRNPIYVSERDIWFCSVGLNVGSEQSGKHKLFERISPKKTWEGTIAGTLVTGLTAGGFSCLVPGILLADWMMLALLVVIFGSFGDLTESMIKRSLNIKDSGNILPGHGGILDRFDTFFISAPFVFLYFVLRNI